MQAACIELLRIQLLKLRRARCRVGTPELFATTREYRAASLSRATSILVSVFTKHTRDRRTNALERGLEVRVVQRGFEARNQRHGLSDSSSTVWEMPRRPSPPRLTGKAITVRGTAPSSGGRFLSLCRKVSSPARRDGPVDQE